MKEKKEGETNVCLSFSLSLSFAAADVDMTNSSDDSSSACILTEFTHAHVNSWDSIAGEATGLPAFGSGIQREGCEIAIVPSHFLVDKANAARKRRSERPQAPITLHTEWRGANREFSSKKRAAANTY